SSSPFPYTTLFRSNRQLHPLCHDQLAPQTAGWFKWTCRALEHFLLGSRNGRELVHVFFVEIHVASRTHGRATTFSHNSGKPIVDRRLHYGGSRLYLKLGFLTQMINISNFCHNYLPTVFYVYFIGRLTRAGRPFTVSAESGAQEANPGIARCCSDAVAVRR